MKKNTISILNIISRICLILSGGYLLYGVLYDARTKLTYILLIFAVAFRHVMNHLYNKNNLDD